MNKKFFITMIILLLILVIALIIFAVWYEKERLAKEEQEMLEDQERFAEFRREYEAQTILPRGIYELYDYKGYYDRDDLYKNMKQFVDYMQYIKENVTTNTIQSFYQEKAEEILKTTGIETYEDFVAFYQQIASVNVAQSAFQYAEVVSGSSYSKGGYFYFDLNLYYENNSEPLSFQVAFAQERRKEVQVRYELK